MAGKPKYAKKSGTSEVMRASTFEKKNLGTGGDGNLNSTGHHHPNGKIKADEMFKRPSSAPSNIFFFGKLNLNVSLGMNEMAGSNIANNHAQKNKPVPDFFGGKHGQSPKNLYKPSRTAASGGRRPGGMDNFL
jgi:hypothetical protein